MTSTSPKRGQRRELTQAAFVEFGRGFYVRIGKRCLDLALTIPALLTLSPFLLAIAVLTYLNLGSPVLFRQERVGHHGRIFRLIKFRTMSNARDATGRLLPDGDRLTPFGLFLRRWSLDELPQLLNVLVGELSLVGPRPLLVRYLPRYTARQRRRHLCRPGITGWAQVNGRNLTSWEARFEDDLWYVEHCSLALDLRILFLTLLVVLTRDDAVATAGMDLDEFWGQAGAPRSGPRALPADETEWSS